MNNEVAIALISGGFGVGGTLGGAVVASCFGRLQRNDEKRDRQRLEQREAVIEILDAGRVWHSAYEPLILAAGVISDPVTLTEMDSFKDFGPINARYRRSLVAGRLIVVDDSVAPIVQELSALVNGTESIMGPVVEEALKKGRASADAIVRGMAYVDIVKDKLTALETATLAAFDL